MVGKLVACMAACARPEQIICVLIRAARELP
jgi:hypothetical protein